MRQWRRAKSVLAACAVAFLTVGGSVMVAGTAQATVSADVAVSVTASPQVNQPLANSGCYPSGLSRSYKVVTFRTTSTVTGSFRAAMTATNGELVAALYDGSFNPANTVAHCLKRTVGAAGGESGSSTGARQHQSMRQTRTPGPWCCLPMRRRPWKQQCP